MAGVAGIRHFAAEDAPPRMLARMLSTMQHRYRSGAETWTSGPLELAVANDPHRTKRPSFVAPPTSRCGRYTCAFDGVLTNRTLLRERIASSWCRVRGLQDAELILEHISAFGMDETLARLDGAFVLGVWDHQTQSLTLGRDRFGLRSVCFRVLRSADGTLQHVAFASEAKALSLADEDQSPTGPCGSAVTFITPAHRQLLSRLSNLPLTAAGSADGEVIDVAPGHAVTFRADGVRVEQAFASLSGLIDDPGHRLELRALSPSDRIDRVIDAASRSIRAQTDGAENIICLVGGDLASTVLAALSVRLGIKIRLLHVDPGCARRRGTCESLAERLNAPLITMRATDAAVRANLVEATWHLEAPMPMRSLAVPLYQACHRAAGLRADVVLHGGGGRDLFGTPMAALRRALHRWTTAAGIRNLTGTRAASGRSILDRLTQSLRQTEHQHAANNPGEGIAAELLAALEGRVRRAERLSAAWGVELRMPLLTEELVALATALPAVHPAQLLPMLRHPRAACAMLSPLGQMAGRLLSPELIGACTLSGEDLPDADLPVDPDFLETGSLMQWLGCGRRDQLDAALDDLTAADRQELLLCDIWARLFITETPCDDVTRALLGHAPAGSSAERAPEHDRAADAATAKRVAA